MTSLSSSPSSLPYVTLRITCCQLSAWSSAVWCLLIVLMLERERKGWWSGERRRETDVRNQRDPCCHVWMQHWLRSERIRGRDNVRVALCSLVEVPYWQPQDWSIELCIAHNINSVLLSLSFSLPHHSSFPSLPCSISLPSSPSRCCCSRSLAGPSPPY